MATNKNLKSNNKVLQSLDLYANDLLNVSHIVGNEDYSTRVKDLEISTKDFNSDSENPSSAGNLLLRAGKADTSGYVRVFAGADSEASIPSNLQLNPDGTAYFQETTSLTAEAPTVNITGKGTNGTVYVLGKSNVQIGQGSDTTFSGLTNQVKFTDGNITVNTTEETHSVGTAFVIENLNRITSPTGTPTSVFKVQNIDQKLGTANGNRLEGIQAESNCIDIHASRGLKLSTDRGYGYLEISSEEITPGLGQFDHSLLSYIDIAEVKADKTIKFWTPKASDLSSNSPIDSRYIKLDQTDSGIELDSTPAEPKVPGLKIRNNYTDIKADKKLIIYNHAANKLVMTDTSTNETVTGTISIDTGTGTVIGSASVLLKVPRGASETHIKLQNNSKTLDIQAADGLNTTVVAGGSTETVTGGKSVTASTGNIELTADSGYINFQSQSTSNYLQLDHTSDKLRANNQTAVINSTGTLLLENASSLKNPDETLPATYIKLSGTNSIEEKSGTITETGTTSITLKADGDNNKITLTKNDSSLEVVNTTETHKNAENFKVLVPSTATVSNIDSDDFTTSGTILGLTATGTKISTDSVNIATTLNSRIHAKKNIYLTAGLGTHQLGPDESGYDPENPTKKGPTDNTIHIALKDIEGDNWIKLLQTKGTSPNEIHDVLEIVNQNTLTRTANYDLTASDNLKIKSSSHGAGGHDRHAAFELDASPTAATVKLNDLKVNQSIKLGNTVTGDTTGLDSVNSVPAGTASVTVAGAISKLGLTGADNNLAVQLGGLKLGDNVSTGSAAAGNTLLEVEHANVTGYTRVNNLDITGEIRIGAVASTSASASSGLTKADDSSIGVSFSNFSTVADDAHAASNSDLIVNVQDFSLKATQTGTISTGSTLDIDSTGALTIDSGTSIGIGTDANKHVPVTIDASNLTISGDKSGSTNNLVIESQSTAYPSASGTTKSFVKAEAIQATSDFYGNNIHMYWDSTTGSLVFASTANS